MFDKEEETLDHLFLNVILSKFVGDLLLRDWSGNGHSLGHCEILVKSGLLLKQRQYFKSLEDLSIHYGTGDLEGA